MGGMRFSRALQSTSSAAVAVGAPLRGWRFVTHSLCRCFLAAELQPAAVVDSIFFLPAHSTLFSVLDPRFWQSKKVPSHF